ncbi:diguanylate cyclase [Desulfonatronospira sp. MSAO_Bac3]|uniref:GGDEF domain-containing response regulator n=1 Tax=Desulfonatronospira sp. MSAO_Bac3 TaxID=2293857 RepID=UPI000FF3CD65|nr:diguanylate cyclase [Desulfonatronospira sp. MSAO_Bac3]RQD77937.1 MAG: diguanylate cyclase [Desulfonatronospira sp. MSAO_Bac3]
MNANAKEIMVVEDDPVTMMQTSRVLQEAGYNVLKAPTGEKAMEMVYNRRPALVLLDVMLPDMGGLEICRKIKSDSRLQGTYVIMFSGVQTESDDRAQGLESGADGYLVKPVRTRELLAQIEAMLRIRYAEMRLDEDRRWYEMVLNSIRELVLCMDHELTILWANQAAADSLDMRAEELIGRKCYHLWNENDKPCRKCPVTRSLESKSPDHSIVDTPDGRIWEVRAYPVKDEHDRMLSIVEVAQDITDMQKSRQALERSEKLLKEVTANMPGAVIQYQVQEEKGLLPLFVSRGVTELLGVTPEDILKDPVRLWDNVHPDDSEQVSSSMGDSLNRNEPFHGEFRVLDRDNSYKWLRISTVPYSDVREKMWYAMISDITLLKKAQEEMAYRAMHDYLTELPNRELLLDRLERAFAMASRYGHKVGVVFFDLNSFKPVNDLYGHMAGDKLLYQVGQRLQKCVRKSDTVARYGGDEFVVVLGSISSSQDVLRVARKISSEMSRPFVLEGVEIHQDFSMGISIYPDDAADPQELLRLADQSMYRAKKDPKSCYAFCSG